MRHLTDTEGREWRVYERTAGVLSPPDSRTSLVFDSDGLVRRLWHYPSTWAALSDGDLLGLMDATAGAGTARV
jgi:hypothetical protein